MYVDVLGLWAKDGKIIPKAIKVDGERHKIDRVSTPGRHHRLRPLKRVSAIPYRSGSGGIICFGRGIGGIWSYNGVSIITIPMSGDMRYLRRWR